MYLVHPLTAVLTVMIVVCTAATAQNGQMAPSDVVASITSQDFSGVTVAKDGRIISGKRSLSKDPPADADLSLCSENHEAFAGLGLNFFAGQRVFST